MSSWQITWLGWMILIIESWLKILWPLWVAYYPTWDRQMQVKSLKKFTLFHNFIMVILANKKDKRKNQYVCLFISIGKTGFEPATSTSRTWRSTKLSYFPSKKYIDTQKTTLSNNWINCLTSHLSLSIGKTGFEPATPWSQTRCSTKLSYFPIKNAPSRSRTYNLLIRSQTLYPVALWVHISY